MMIRIILLFIVLLINSALSDEGKSSFSSEKYLFSFTYPTTWKIFKAEMSDILPDFIDFSSGKASLGSAKQTSDENEWNTLLFRADNMPYFDISIHKKKSPNYQDFKNNYYKLFDVILQNNLIYQEESEEENINGLVLYRLVYDLNYNQAIRNKIVVTYQNGNQYLFRFWCFLDQYADFDKKFEELILSLKFDKK